MYGKGSKRRPTNEVEYRNNWNTIFNKKKNYGKTKIKSDKDVEFQTSESSDRNTDIATETD
jgi:hypothetical protein